ncbi:hypothetical protein BASA62_000831 [Batrachochytrium salamandrivorans]|nr:hypothetical protein BASA62_000831 [Batrachochytrium salamandrivorans]
MIASALIATLAIGSAMAAPSAKRVSIAPMHHNSVVASVSSSIGYNMGAPLLTGDCQYISGNVNLASTYSDNYSIGKSQSGNDLPGLIQSYIDAGTFPEDTNAVYYILNSSDVSESALGSSFCSGYCGYHSETTLTSGSQVYYALSGAVPDSCISGCAPPPNQSVSPNGDIAVDAMLSVMAHEIAEAVSDPDANIRAWNDATGYENGDMCAYTYGSTSTDDNGASHNTAWGGMNFMIQQNWDPVKQACGMSA